MRCLCKGIWLSEGFHLPCSRERGLLRAPWSAGSSRVLQGRGYGDPAFAKAFPVHWRGGKLSSLTCWEHFSADMMKSWPSCRGFAHRSWFGDGDQAQTPRRGGRSGLGLKYECCYRCQQNPSCWDSSESWRSKEERRLLFLKVHLVHK